MTLFDDINPDLLEDASFGHAYFGMTSMEADCGDYDSLLGHPSSSEEAVSFPFSRIDHGHAEMDINPLFHDPPINLPQSLQWPHDTKDLEVTDKSITQWNSPELEDRSKDGMEIRMSKHTHKPPASHGVVAVGWLPSAVTYLMDLELGEEWQDLLIVWQALEAVVHQARRYRIMACSADGLAFELMLQSTFLTDLLTWWNALQPGWCCSDTGLLPLKDYSRVLNKALHKGGPNSIIIMLIGLMWWGHECIDVDLGTKARRTLMGGLVALVNVEAPTFMSKGFGMVGMVT
ncbi:hypothetical protein EDD18DRAFT_1112474 [Armillaria luteobubalina]|uniref:Uncharacterized protein n=1 Tax=Armillaria luteobubalina TaxID=153913 RepID=A0AA39PEL8_9AGAR|nr:hypothetical protein EDD18DRAFT_1112474 [Armillaria luteobubalina]